MAAIQVLKLQDADEALSVARTFLLARPVLHNIVLTLLDARRQRPEPGRYWVASEARHVQGVAFQSPLTFEATVTPMPVAVARAVADSVAHEDPALPGVNGEAATAAVLAGQWSERTKRPAVPWQGQRLYEARAISPPAGVSGGPRPGRPSDRDLLVEWVRGLHEEATPGEPGHPQATVDARLPAGHMWI
jgi:hypothetical protein